jgi:hypothetical protein
VASFRVGSSDQAGLDRRIKREAQKAKLAEAQTARFRRAHAKELVLAASIQIQKSRVTNLNRVEKKKHAEAAVVYAREAINILGELAEFDEACQLRIVLASASQLVGDLDQAIGALEDVSSNTSILLRSRALVLKSELHFLRQRGGDLELSRDSSV